MERLLLSIIETLKFFHEILLGFRIHIHSDHKNLSFNTFKSEWVCCWHLPTEDYDYTFIYAPVTDNVIADIISWYPIYPATPSELQQVCTTTEVLPLGDEEEGSCPIEFLIIAQH